MTLAFQNRTVFEKAVPMILTYGVRQESSGNLDIQYAEMKMVFEDIHHFNRAVIRLRAESLNEFNIST